MALTRQDIEAFAECLQLAIKKEFAYKHLSKNLVNTVKISVNLDGGLSVEIPAETYNMYKYFKDKVVVPSGRGGSYASRLDEEGSAFMVYWSTAHQSKRKKVEPRNHIGYIEKVVNDALSMWLVRLNNKYEIKAITDL